MSEVKVNKVSPRSGTTVTIGDSGDTINIVGTLQNNGSALTGDISSVVAGTGLSGGATSGVATLNIEAAQPTITSLGTITGFTSTGIDDNADATAITIDSSERIGINNTSPSTKLHLDIGTDNVGLYQNSTDATSGFSLADNGGSINLATTSSGAFRVLVGGDANTSADNSSEAMRILSDGKVGVGTSNPGAKLDVVDSSNSVQMIIRGRSSDNFGILQFKNNAGSASKGEIKSDASNNLIFRAGASTDDLTILENGNVGIGQSTPSQKLDVVGNAEINGNIYNNGKLNIRKDGSSESEHLVITNENAGSNSSPTFTDLHFNGYSGKDRGRIRVQDQSNNKVGGFMRIETAGSESTDGSAFETRIFLDNDGDIFFYEDTGTTAKLKWDATNERLGIRTTSPQVPFEVKQTTTECAHFGGSSSTNNVGQFTGISLGYGEPTNLNYRKVKIVSAGLGDGSARQDLKFLVDTTADGNSAALGDSKLAISGTTGVVSGDLNDTSDIGFKENITNITDSLTLVKQLKPRFFTWKGAKSERGNSTGFIAQEVEEIIPLLVQGNDLGSTITGDDGSQSEDMSGKSINTIGLVAHLTKALQEQQTKIEELEARITTLENA